MHHSSTPFDEEQNKRFADILRPLNRSQEEERRLRQQFGATGKFPEGKITETDEGEIAFGVAIDHTSGKVIINFGKPTAWIGMSKQQALELAESLVEHANELA